MERIESILKQRLNRRCRGRWPFEAYFKKIENAEKLLKKIEKTIRSKDIIQEARKQFVTASITAFEVYFKDRFLSLLKVFGNERFLDNVKVKFDLNELKKILENSISISEVISSDYNFQDLDQIHKAFSTALNVNFIEELKKRKFSISKDLEPIKVGHNDYLKIQQFIGLRHEFVHEINFKKNITRAELDKYLDALATFVLAVDIYTEEKIREIRPKNV